MSKDLGGCEEEGRDPIDKDGLRQLICERGRDQGKNLADSDASAVHFVLLSTRYCARTFVCV